MFSSIVELRAQLRAIPGAPSINTGGEPVVMIPTFAPGKTYRFVSNNVVRMQLPGQGIREATVEQQTRLDASPRTDGRVGVSVKARVERLKVDFRSGEEQVTYDSFKEEDRSSTLGQHFRDSLNRWVDLKMSPGLDILSATPGGREGLGTVLPGVPEFGLSEVEKLVAEVPQGLPPGKVRPGESWEISGTREIEGIGALIFEITYRYVRDTVYEGHSCYEIEVRGRLGGEAQIEGNVGALSGAQMFFEGTSLSGRILFDPAEGTIRLSEKSVSMLMELPAINGGSPSQIPVEQDATIRLLHVVPTP